MNTAIPPTAERVERHTSKASNARIQEAMVQRVLQCEQAGTSAMTAQIAELEREWDIERVLEANAASVALVGLGLGLTLDRKWLALPAAVAIFLLQHAVQGWCPPLPLFRKLGVRTAREIHEEIIALKILRGDFLDAPRSIDDVIHHARLQ